MFFQNEKCNDNTKGVQHKTIEKIFNLYEEEKGNRTNPDTWENDRIENIHHDVVSLDQ